ncbi:S41 family peptidase [Psychroserpens sp. S379A]|uniref:S41 family peptidase n=1 Tax=Psychroserpens sp. S379A TaxID=3415137 RepID=UPI003C7B51E2
MKLKKLGLLFLIALTFTSCFEDNDDNAIAASEINDFIWKAMNAAYLYKANVDDLANNRFSNSEQYSNFLNGFSTPENIFDHLTYDPLDRFSDIIPNYINFLQGQDGTSLTNGVEFNFHVNPQNPSLIIGVVRLVLPGSDGDDKGLVRGQIFNAVDGIALTNENFTNFLSQNSYTLNLATYNDNGTPQADDDTIESTNNSINLVKEVYTENPIFLSEVLEVGSENVGYLMYNQFNNEYESELNAAFAQFQASNVQHLVLDLRYNPGGVISTAALLGSMVTGQFNGQVFSKVVYNEDQQEENRNFNFVSSFNDTPVNSLNLNKVYVLTSRSSASASELVINSLKEYITVIQVGENTVGKTQASVTLFDSPNFGQNNINPNHTYALQPLVANSINVNDEAVPNDGLPADIQYTEVARNYGVLGDANEPLLAAALLDIQGLGRYAQPHIELMPIKKDFNLKPFEDHMYITLDDISIDRLQFE